MRIARRAGHKRMPWKNGQGLTEEVQVWPKGSGIDGFDWRLSIAHIGADGPFSVFPDVDRTIAGLDGAGMILDLPDGGRVDLRPNGAPFAFPGDWSISSRNLGGTTIDLNVMTRRGRCAHEMRRLRLAPGMRFAAPGAGWGVLNTSAVLQAERRSERLERFDAVCLENGEAFRVSDDAPVEFLFTVITPLAVA